MNKEPPGAAGHPLFQARDFHDKLHIMGQPWGLMIISFYYSLLSNNSGHHGAVSLRICNCRFALALQNRKQTKQRASFSLLPLQPRCLIN
jgi:hypothetical protein